MVSGLPSHKWLGYLPTLQHPGRVALAPFRGCGATTPATPEEMFKKAPELK